MQLLLAHVLAVDRLRESEQGGPVAAEKLFSHEPLVLGLELRVLVGRRKEAAERRVARLCDDQVVQGSRKAAQQGALAAGEAYLEPAILHPLDRARDEHQTAGRQSAWSII